MSIEETSESSSLQVAPLCSNILDCLWKDMSELVWMGNNPDSIFMHLVEEYVMKSCRYTTVKSHCKVVSNVYTGGSCLSRTVVKPDSHLAQIFVAKFFCIIKLNIIIG